MEGVSIQNFTRRPTASRALFTKLADAVLPHWEISLVFVGPAKARALNTQMRRKTYVPNVLSYIVGKRSGEIIICPAEAARQAPSYALSEKNFILYLFIHGLLHIKGWAHSDKMEKCERKLLASVASSVASAVPNETTNRNRHRHRHVPSKNGRRRGALR